MSEPGQRPGRQPGPQRGQRGPADPSHRDSTLAELFAEPFLNARRYLENNNMEPLPNEDTGVEVWAVKDRPHRAGASEKEASP